MFFMMCVNFVTKQVNESIQLPVMQSARPMDRRETDVLYLNLNSSGQLEVIGRQPMSRDSDMKFYLRRQFEDTQRLARANGKDDSVKTTIIIRADRATAYKNVYQLMEMCKQVGYRRFQMRALTKPESERSAGDPPSGGRAG
jgi:biopolymer transport protein ExbD